MCLICKFNLNFGGCKLFKILSVISSLALSSVTDHLKDLHWLPVKHHIEFELCIITYKTMVYGMPPYFCHFIVPYCPSVIKKRSNTSNKLLTSSQIQKAIDSCFSVAGPKLWNSLPLGARSANTLGAFRKLLKSNLFDLAFPPDQ